MKPSDHRQRTLLRGRRERRSRCRARASEKADELAPFPERPSCHGTAYHITIK
jgi:hypothetical protein